MEPCTGRSERSAVRATSWSRWFTPAPLGARVYELAKGQARFGGRPPQVLDDDQVKALLQDLGSLDSDLRNAASRSLEPDRLEA
jgi:hypothetical protein